MMKRYLVEKNVYAYINLTKAKKGKRPQNGTGHYKIIKRVNV